MKSLVACLLVLSTAAALPVESLGVGAVARPAQDSTAVDPTNRIPNPDPKPNVQVVQIGETCDPSKNIVCSPGLDCLPQQNSGIDRHQWKCVDVNTRRFPETTIDAVLDLPKGAVAISVEVLKIILHPLSDER
ncbi:hypothetical protein TWF718_009904 [Orbilia javanica]|uniref:Uncharacterized protein n=1 Tax=Orbilia javanica TaxID=47235 RepID=A0AAN8RG63_9PEZI